MENTEIKPALTAKEWREKSTDGAFLTPDGMLGADDGVESITVRDRHALAALALYDQPFGFTPEDVAELRWLATYEDPLTPVEWKIANGYRNATPIPGRLRDLADRIEALLPQEKK